jgi:hypothetical protein
VSSETVLTGGAKRNGTSLGSTSSSSHSEEIKTSGTLFNSYLKCGLMYCAYTNKNPNLNLLSVITLLQTKA